MTRQTETAASFYDRWGIIYNKAPCWWTATLTGELSDFWQVVAITERARINIHAPVIDMSDELVMGERYIEFCPCCGRWLPFDPDDPVMTGNYWTRDRRNTGNGGWRLHKCKECRREEERERRR